MNMKNLIYHIYPKKDNKEVWKWNLRQICRYFPLFNGTRTFGIVTDDTTVKSTEVEDYIAAQVPYQLFNSFQKENVKHERECCTLPVLLHDLNAVQGMTFFAHAKGVTRPQESPAVRTWAAAMYEACLSRPWLVDEQLDRFCCTGAFKRYGGLRYPGSDNWDYEGTFWWFNNSDLFNRAWRYIPNRFYGAEIYPSCLFKKHEAGCLVLDNCGDLYDWQAWQDRIIPEMKKWRQKNPSQLNS